MGETDDGGRVEFTALPAAFYSASGATLSGRVAWEGTTPPPLEVAGAPAGVQSDARRVEVRVEPAPASGMQGFASGRQDPTSEAGRFRLAGVRGIVVLEAMAPGGALTGVVTDTRDQPMPGMEVILFPDDPGRWYRMSPFVRSTRTATAAPAAIAAQVPGAPASSAARPVISTGPGRFAFGRMLPGQYLVAARELDGTPGDQPGVLAALRSKATSVTITAGRTATVELEVER